MAHIRPFNAVRYSPDLAQDLSRLIAPPYDVLNEQGKAALQSRHPNNIVTVDLPHLPPKTVGPDSVYEQANSTLQSWLATNILAKSPRPAFYPYMQTYEHNERAFHRRGFFGLVRLSPFGAGEVVPHEKTHAEPIQDRLKLMRFTRTQLSPIFGLFNDPKNEVTNLLYHNISRPILSATLDGVRNDLWAVPDAEVGTKVIDLFGHKPVYIADGHHRYTTALNYQDEIRQQLGGKVPDAHPANWCLFSLVSMQDPGLLILPTHRLIGGLRSFNAALLAVSIKDHFDMTEVPLGSDGIAEFAHTTLPKLPAHTFGLFDGSTRKLYKLHLKDPSVLKPLEPDKSDAWRRLDAAILHRYLLDEVIRPRFSPGHDPVVSYTADPDEIAPQVDGSRYQIALMLQSTPLHTLEELGRHGEVMPQKSTYFYPKLATGMVINPL
ncbi:MAG: DUF1015 domain-containing protein [Planctomycetota bacterium]|nr:DUF1015 domain-containing protein [Planctomycetota bacterium]